MSARLTAEREAELRGEEILTSDEAAEVWAEFDAVRAELAACQAELHVLRSDTDPASVVGAASRDREEA